MKTVLQIAREINISKQALEKRLSRSPLKEQLQGHISKTEKGVKLIDAVGETIIIKNAIDINIDTAVDTNTDVVIDTTIDAIAALIKQLEIKDKQIDDLNNRLAESNSALVAAQQSLTAEQTLHAGTIQSRLLTDSEKKAGLWSKIFKKKNQ